MVRTLIALSVAVIATAGTPREEFEKTYAVAGDGEVWVTRTGQVLIFAYGDDTGADSRLIAFTPFDAREIGLWIKSGQSGRIVANANYAAREIAIVLPDESEVVLSVADAPRDHGGRVVIAGYEFYNTSGQLADIAAIVLQLDALSTAVVVSDASGNDRDPPDCAGGGVGACSCTVGTYSVTCGTGYYACCVGSPCPGGKCAFCVSSSSGGCQNPN